MRTILPQRRFARLFFSLVVALTVSAPAHAHITAVYTGTTLSGSNVRFNYDIRLKGQQLIVAGGPAELITIFDIPGYVAGSATFTLRSELRAALTGRLEERLSGMTPSGVEVPDDRTLTNIVVSFDTLPPTETFGAYSDLSLGTLTVASIFPGRDPGGRFASQSNEGRQRGLELVSYQGQVTVPSAEGAYQVNYTSGSGGTLRLINPGVYRDESFPAGPMFDRAPVCANVYVFRPGGQLLACCSCPVTANGMRRVNVAASLLSNPLQTPLVPPVGVTQDAAVKIVASAGGVCESPVAPAPGLQVIPPTAAGPYSLAPYGLRAWATHIQGAAGSPTSVTETEFLPAKLSFEELRALQEQCAFATHLGTGAGVCTCGPPPGPHFDPEMVKGTQ